MQCALNFDQAQDCWRLDGELTIYVVGQMKTALQDVLLTSSSVTFDASAVTAIDGAGLQLLQWFERFCRSKSVQFRMQQPSECMLQLSRDCKIQWPTTDGKNAAEIEAEDAHVQ